MKLFFPVFLIAGLAMSAFCQETPAAPEPDPMPAAKIMDDQAAQMDIAAQKMADKAAEISSRMAEFDADKVAGMAEKAAAMANQFSASADLDQKLSQLKMQIDSQDLSEMTAAAADLASQAKMAFLQAPPKAPAPPRPPTAPMNPFRFKGDSAYNAGTRALDDHKYDEAVRNFDSAISQDPSRADGALYWKAYALNREGKRDDALAAIAQLRRDYASSAWLNDAQALEAEVKRSSGQPVSPAQESNDDLKLLAINSLMNADAERAIPLVEGILKGNSTPNVKERALFVLSQNKSPQAQQALVEYAKGAGNPDLQLQAIQYLGMSGTKESQQVLVGLYGGSSDARVKNAIIQGLMMSRATDALMTIAKSEKDPSLRGSAIRQLAMNKNVSVEGLMELYNGSDAPGKREVIDGLMARGDAKSLVELARKETDPALKRTIVERLSAMRNNKDAMDYMMELLK